MIEIGNVTFNKELVDKLIKKGFEESEAESWIAEDFIFKEVENDCSHNSWFYGGLGVLL